MDVNTIKRIIFRLFPEMTGRWHLPRWGRVVALPELPEEGELSDRFYPHYAVDVQLLDEKGMEYQDKPPLPAVPLPVPGLGDHAGRLEPPAIGSIVELGFMFGQPDKPFIRCVLPLGFKLPAIKEGESRYQQRQGVYHLVDQGGNFENKTDQSLKDIIGKLAQLECETRKVIASKEQDHRSPKSWFGSEEENVLRLLSELMQVVAGLAGTCATHTHPIGTHHDVPHGNSGAPATAGDFEGQGTSCTQLKARLDPITK